MKIAIVQQASITKLIKSVKVKQMLLQFSSSHICYILYYKVATLTFISISLSWNV